MVRRKYAKLYCWLRLSYANQALNIVLLALDRTSVWSYHRGQRNRNQDQHASGRPYVGATVPSALASQLSCRSHSGQASKRGGALGADIYDTLIAVYLPKIGS